MKKNEYENFRTMYIKGVDMVALAILAFSVSAISIWMMILLSNVWAIVLFGIPSLFFPLFIDFIRTVKVRLGPNYIETLSVFKKKRIYLKNVAQFGVFFKGRSVGVKLIKQQTIDEISDDELFGHIIYLSSTDTFDIDSLRPMHHVKFHYRRELYHRIKRMIAATDSK